MEDTLIFKPNKSIMIGKAVLGTLILGILSAGCLFAILNISPIFTAKMGVMPWIGFPVFLWCISTVIIRCLPGQGELTLTQEGFELKDWGNRSKKMYRWNEVVGFYIKTTHNRHRTFHHVFFEVTYSNTRKQLTDYSYNHTNEQLVKILNSWKERYAKNAEGVELTPTLDLPPEKGPSLIKKMAIQFGMLIPIMGIIWVYFAYFATLDIRVRNNTTDTIQNIAITTLKSESNQRNRFHIASLQPGQEAEIKTPFLEFGVIKVKYNSTSEPVCTLLQHQECTWSSEDILFLEPGGQVAANSTYCKSIDDLSPIASSPCNSQIDDELQETTIEIKEVKVKPLENNNKKNPENTKAYISLMQQEIQKHFHPPTIRYTTFPSVTFIIYRNGSISDIKLESSSHKEALDNAALQAVTAVKQLPPFPSDVKESKVTIHYHFDFMNTKKSQKK